MDARGYRSGFVAVIGRPNAGKSTLMNRLLGEKVAIVSPKPQTTRDALIGVYTRPGAQAVFVDTPGYHRPRTALGEYMVESVHRALPDADLVLHVADISLAPTEEDRRIAARLGQAPAVPAWLIANKSDLVPAGEKEIRAASYLAFFPYEARFFVSAALGTGAEALLEAILARLPEGSPYYDEEALTDQTERKVVEERIREQVLALMQEEVPHAVAVRVEDFKERDSGTLYISAALFVEKESQKGILIGAGGERLKEIGRRARQDIEAFLGRKVFLELWVKVEKNWRKNPASLRRLGYPVKPRRAGG
ncbi:MAG: GTPase Era [Armatimonadetes bacterium]|nr:GTPase Era [Armatimonadota bacterium]